jgi:hypothetical protein
MRRNFILSESEIRQLVKKTLLNEQLTNSNYKPNFDTKLNLPKLTLPSTNTQSTNTTGNKSIQDLQTLLASKGFTEVGTADNKAGQNTLSALNRALGLGLTMYRPQTNQQTTTPQKNIVKSPSTVDFEKINNPSPDGKLAGVNTNQGTQITPANQTDYAANKLTGKQAPSVPNQTPTYTDQNKIPGLEDQK